MFSEKNAGRWKRAACALMAALCVLWAAGSAAEGPDPEEEHTWEDQYGVVHSLSEFQGKVVVLNFWATWCGYCVREMPDFQKVYEEMGSNEGDVLIFGVASRYTEGTTDESGVKQFLTRKGIAYPTLMDSEGFLTSMFGIEAYPTNWFVCADGSLAGYTYTLSAEELREIIRGVQAMGAGAEAENAGK